MSDILKVNGIVLAAYPLGENDKSLTVLTRERGRIQLISRGCRKTGSPLFAASNEYVCGEFVIAEKRTVKYLNSAEIRQSFAGLRDSFDDICYSAYLCELAAWFTMEGQDESNILNLLSLTFVTMGKKILPLPLIRRIYEFKILQFHGMGIQSAFCVHCGKTEDLHSFSFEEGGVLCDDCSKTGDTREIGPLLLRLLQYLGSCRLNDIYSFTVSQELFVEFDWVVNRFFKIQTGHRFRSEQMLEMM